MEIGKPVREIIVEPLELPAPVRPAEQPTEAPQKAEPVKEPVRNAA